MQNFIISFNVVFPIFMMMVLGFVLKRKDVFNDVTVKQMNASVFKMFLPVMIFKNVYESDITEVFNKRLLFFAVICVFICIAVLFLIVPVFEKDNRKKGVLIQGIFRSNFVIFGIPVSEALYGEAATGTAAVLIAVIIPVFNFFAVITLEIFNGKKPNFFKTTKAIASNPLIIGSLLGIIVNYSGLKFPTVVEATIANLSKVTTPLALIMLGASINLKTIEKNLYQLLVGVSTKLVIIPAIFLFSAAYMFGFSGVELTILLSLFASPPAVSSFTMAQQMGGDGDLAGQLVMFGTTLSLLTMFLWIFTLIEIGLI